MTDLAAGYSELDARFQPASTVATHAEILRDSYWARDLDFVLVSDEAARLAREFDGDHDVAEFARLVDRVAEIGS